MEIITTIFSYFWYEIFFILFAIAVVYKSRVRFYPYKPHNISDRVPADFETFYRSSEDALYDLYWIRLGTFHCTHPKEHNVIIARFFCSPDYNHGAMLLQCKPSAGDDFYLTEFCTELSPCGSILTNNNPFPDSLTYENKFVFKFPSVNYVNILHAYHLEFCNIAQSESFTLRKLKPENLEEYLYQVFIRDYEYQVKKGRMKRVGDDNSFSWTLRGSISAVPAQAIFFLYSALFSFYRPNQDRMKKRLKKKLSKIQQRHV